MPSTKSKKTQKRRKTKSQTVKEGLVSSRNTVLQNIIKLEQTRRHALARRHRRYQPLPTDRPRLDIPAGGGGASSSAVAAPQFNVTYPPFPAMSAAVDRNYADLEALRQVVRDEMGRSYLGTPRLYSSHAHSNIANAFQCWFANIVEACQRGYADRAGTFKLL